MTETIAEMRSFDVVGVLGYDPEPVAHWSEAAPELFIPAVRFAIGSRYDHSIERSVSWHPKAGFAFSAGWKTDRIFISLAVSSAVIILEPAESDE